MKPSKKKNTEKKYVNGESDNYRHCTCGRLSSMAMDEVNAKSNSIDHCGSSNNKSRNNKKMNNVWLESSFVHLMTPRNIHTNNYLDNNKEHSSSISSQNTNNHRHQQQLQQRQRQQTQHGFLEKHQHLLQLLEVVYNHTDHGETETKTVDTHDGTVELCVDCIDRVASAFEVDTQRLYAEVEVYKETVLSSKQRMKSLQRTAEIVSSTSSVSVSATNTSLQTTTTRTGQTNNNNNNNKKKINNRIEEAYQQEISLLEQEVQDQYDELFHLNEIYNEQEDITNELDRLEKSLQMEQNSLELQSQAFDNRRQVLTKTLSEVQNEVDKLMCISLPRALFDLQVDHARGLHYPVINQLRLAFRPKGDVNKKEIQVAWSQATQLLLILGTIFEYHGLDWKLVPLVDCAKLIYRKEIFNLAPGDCRSLMAWNALLDQVVKHALSIVRCGVNLPSTSSRVGGSSPNKNRSYADNNKISSTSSVPPFSSSPTMIGGTELARLEPSDDVGWSLVIHKMVSNLLWLSNRASDLAATQVSSMAHCVV